MRSDVHVLMIGGGIGGLTAAIALQQAGIRVSVYERAPALHEIGAGLSLWANAVRALDTLGLAAPLLARGVPEGSGAIRTARGETLVEAASHDLERRYGAKSVIVHRAELQALLRDALPADVLHLGAALHSFTESGQGVCATFADGSTACGDVLIGADGIHSAVRAQLWGAAKPRYAGYTAWRAVVPFPHAQLLPGETWGCGQRFGIAPMTDGRVYWFATQNAPEGQPDGAAGRKADVLTLFRAFHAPIPQLIAATHEALILRNDIYDRPPLKQWGRGRTTLLGDAAHAMTPNLGQGACQAIEDAVVLARCLHEHREPIVALRRYEARRIARTSMLTRQARQLGVVGQWENRVACRLRNALFKGMPSFVRMRQFDRMLGYRAV